MDMDGKTAAASFAVIALTLLEACGGAFGQLPTAERDRFEDCRAHMRPTVCRGEPAGSRSCVRAEREAQEAYAELTGRAERSRWLYGRGCPEQIVAFTAADRQRPPAPQRLPAATTRPRGTVRDDEFTNTRVARFVAPLWGDGPVENIREMRLQFTAGSETGQLAFSALSNEPTWGDCRDLAMLVDEEPASLSQPQYRRLEGSESQIVTTGEGVLSRVLGAQSLRVRVCGEELHLREDALEELHRLRARLEPAGNAATLSEP